MGPEHSDVVRAPNSSKMNALVLSSFLAHPLHILKVSPLKLLPAGFLALACPLVSWSSLLANATYLPHSISLHAVYITLIFMIPPPCLLIALMLKRPCLPFMCPVLLLFLI